MGGFDQQQAEENALPSHLGQGCTTKSFDETATHFMVKKGGMSSNQRLDPRRRKGAPGRKTVAPVLVFDAAVTPVRKPSLTTKPVFSMLAVSPLNVPSNIGSLQAF